MPRWCLACLLYECLCGNLIAPVGALTKLGEFLLKLKGVA